MIQEFIVYGVGIATAVYILFKVYKSLFTKDKDAKSACGHCSCSKSTKLNYKRVVSK